MFVTQMYRFLYRLALKLKPLIILVIPVGIRVRIKTGILKKAYPIEKAKLNQKKVLSNGINLIGYSRAEMGIGESCRIAANSLSAVELPFNILNYFGTSSARMNDMTWVSKETDIPQFDINIFHINAEQMFDVYAHFGENLFENHYNIGYWHWELPDFPEEWIHNFQLVQEIWAPSTFVVDAISMKSPVPVIKIPHSIEVKVKKKRNRAYFSLPESAFLFLTMYDVKSFQERKNPAAAIIAFKKAFNPSDMTVGLVVKVNTTNSSFQELTQLSILVGEYKNIYLIKEVLSRDEVNGLLSLTDCYISLHRSEGFGLGLAEAMYLGKPAIGTNWSSNIDFMNNQNSCLVDFNLTLVGKDYGPYKANQFWAEPDIDHACYYMKKLVNDSAYYKVISFNGERTIKTFYSPEAVGSLIAKRLKYIKL